MQTRTNNCPNCGAPLDKQGVCSNCGSVSRGNYQGLDLGRVDIARAVEQGLDYYLLLGVRADAAASAIEDAYWRLSQSLPPDISRMPPKLAQRAMLIQQAGFVLRDPQRRTQYDELRRLRQIRHTQQNPRSDEATRGLACFRAGHFDEAARLLRKAYQQQASNEVLYIQYALSLLYGSSNLASPEDWRVNEMLQAMQRAREACGENQTIQSHERLFQAVHAYDKDRFAEGWQIMNELTDTLPRWYLPWIVSAYWRRRESKFADVLARAERARALQPDDWLVDNLVKLMRKVWVISPALLPEAARQAARLLGKDASAIASDWK